MKDILKKINKKEKVIIGLALVVLLITFVSITLKDTYAYYNDKTEISLFNAKIGNFKPIINSFYIKGNNIQPKYTNQNINTVYLTWGNNNKNINEMCITEGDINSCNWQVINTSTQYTFATETEGAKIIKCYIKDKAGNKSIEKSDTIIYDKTAPTINKVEATNTTENSITISVTANQDTSGIDKYCYAQAQTGPYTCKSESTNQYTGLEGGKEYTFWIYLKDKAGNGTEGNATQHKFKTANKAIKDYLQEKGGSTFTLKNGMYRFVGTKDQVTHNYICFGTTDLSKCTNNPDEFMYRIIGVTSEADNTIGLHANQLKLIKAIPSNTSQKWNSLYKQADCETDGEENGKCKWDGSDIKTYLNETFLGAVQWESPAYWKGLITSQKWYNVDQRTTPTASAEPTSSQTSNSYQIGLMYATDYMNASTANTSNWLFIANGWTWNSSTTEWTMSRYGLGGRTYYAWTVVTGGTLYDFDLALAWAVRPVFYLQSGVSLVGTGTTADPFRIAA